MLKVALEVYKQEDIANIQSNNGEIIQTFPILSKVQRCVSFLLNLHIL